jgi:peptidyl-prolyl cis-trans isomerase A (cyclophilin A)
LGPAPLRLSLMLAYKLLAVAFLAATSLRAQQPGIVRVLIETDRGNIAVALDSARAPVSVTNFLRYVDGGAYTSGRFHRAVTLANQPNDSVKIQVIQGGANPMRDPSLRFPPIELERTSVTGLRHKDGTLSMARAANPNSASSDFFICIGDQPSLDFGGHRNLDGQGFAAFGQVVGGMEVVRGIQASPVTNQALTPPITIKKITRVK